MADKDPAMEKARKENIQKFKIALKKAATKDNSGNPKWVGFAFSPGDAPPHHFFMMSPRKKGPALSKDLLKAVAKESKGGGTAPKICFGMATVGKADGKAVIWLEYIKKLGGAERKMNEALKFMHIPFLVKPRDEDDSGAAPAAPGPDTGEEDEDGDDDLDLAASGEDEGDDTEEAQGDEEEAGDDEEDDDEGKGEENGDDAGQPPAAETEQPGPAVAAAAQPTAAAPPSTPAAAPFKAGADVWSKTRTLMRGNVAKFKAAVQQEYKDEPPELQTRITQALGKLDGMLEKFDSRLEESLHKAHDAKDDASRKAELANSKKIIADYLKYMASEPMINHLDKNPFGVDMNIKLVLTKSLTGLARTVS